MKASEGSKCYWKKKKHNVAIKGEPFTVFIQYTHTHTHECIHPCVWYGEAEWSRVGWLARKWGEGHAGMFQQPSQM